MQTGPDFLETRRASMKKVCPNAITIPCFNMHSANRSGLFVNIGSGWIIYKNAETVVKI